jgi:membrane protein YdbS with pleckstrin-like domain
MGYPQNLLAPDEVIKFETKPHWRAVIMPAIVLIATLVIGAFLVQWVLSWYDWLQWLRWVVVIGAVVILALWAVVPFLRWLTTEYVFTDRRIIVRQGIVTRRGKDMPLSKVNNVSFLVPPLGRIFNYGVLNIQSAGENDGLTIAGVPDVEDIQRMVYELIEADEKRRRATD